MTRLAPNSPTAGRRRSRRIALTAPLEVSGQDVERSSFTTNTTATSLNRNGAALHLSHDLSLGSELVIKNNRGARISARVVARTVSRDDVYMYGVEFLDEADNVKDFWGIAFQLSRK